MMLIERCLWAIVRSCIHSSVDGFERNRLMCERRAFSSSVRFFALRGTRVGTLCAGRWFNCATRSRSFCRQSDLFRCWLRSSREVTTTPEGKCRSRTAVSVLLTCWPPGPLERKVSTSHSRSKSSSASGNRIIFTSPSSWRIQPVIILSINHQEGFDK